MHPYDGAKDELARLNLEIGAAESRGDEAAKAWLDQVLAPQMAFRRANGVVDGRSEFLEKVRPADQRDTAIEAIDLYGDRAVVRCIVTLKSAAGAKRFHNLRMFVRHEGKWKLLGWANEAQS